MVRMLINLGLTLLANAIGLIVAAAVLEDMALGAQGFVIAVLVFTVAMLLVRPLITKLAIQHATALGGSSALIATLAALIVTTVISDSLDIRGIGTWLAATVIVWAACLLLAVLLPWLVLRRAVKGPRAAAQVPKPTTWG